jgi:hypothetical protein
MASRERFRVVQLGLAFSLRADAMANPFVPRNIKKEMKGTQFGPESKEESKEISNPNPNIKAQDSPPSPLPDPTWSASGMGSNHHCLPSDCWRWVASGPPKGATVDWLDGDTLPLRRACVPMSISMVALPHYPSEPAALAPLSRHRSDSLFSLWHSRSLGRDGK